MTYVNLKDKKEVILPAQIIHLAGMTPLEREIVAVSMGPKEKRGRSLYRKAPSFHRLTR